MGVTGSGKSTVGTRLASRLGWPFVEGDDYHSTSNVEKMRRGIPLTDADREPWLDALSEFIEDCLARQEDVVLACSALTRAYRRKLGGAPGVVYVYLQGAREELQRRLRRRRGHFAGVSLLDSQLDTLEEPDSDEPAINVRIALSPDEIVTAIIEALPHRSD
jgi:gluconokinase